MNQLKNILRRLLPPLIMDWQRQHRKKYGFFGNYPSWQQALRDSDGYDSDAILAKVRQAREQILKGEAAFERDGVVFDKIQYSWPLLAGLLYVASQKHNQLKILDFGGSLGSSYFQNLPMLNGLGQISWNIVEQPNFVKTGKEICQNGQLKFYETIDDCLREQSVDAFLCLGVLQYLEKPYELLAEVIKRKFDYLIFDRTTFITQGTNRLTVQKVPPRIYPASYPAWFFNLDTFMEFFKNDYELVADFDSLNRHTAPGDYLDLGDIVALEKGFIFKRKNQ